jgi:hypothetical protein
VPKEKYEELEQGSFLSHLYQDRIETKDRETGAKVVTVRNKLTGNTSTVTKGKCSDVFLELHARIVDSKWGRPTEGDTLARFFK